MPMSLDSRVFNISPISLYASVVALGFVIVDHILDVNCLTYSLYNSRSGDVVATDSLLHEKWIAVVFSKVLLTKYSLL